MAELLRLLNKIGFPSSTIRKKLWCLSHHARCLNCIYLLLGGVSWVIDAKWILSKIWEHEVLLHWLVVAERGRLHWDPTWCIIGKLSIRIINDGWVLLLRKGVLERHLFELVRLIDCIVKRFLSSLNKSLYTFSTPVMANFSHRLLQSPNLTYWGFFQLFEREKGKLLFLF